MAPSEEFIASGGAGVSLAILGAEGAGVSLDPREALNHSARYSLFPPNQLSLETSFFPPLQQEGCKGHHPFLHPANKAGML